MLQLVLSFWVITLALLYSVYLWRSAPRHSGLPALLAVLLGCVTLEVLDGLTVSGIDPLWLWKKMALVNEGILAACWLWLGCTFKRESPPCHGHWLTGTVWLVSGAASVVVIVAASVAMFYVPLSGLIYAPDFAEERLLFLTQGGFVYYVIIMVCLVGALLQLERTFLALSRRQRWQMKYEFLGVALLLALSIVYYSQSLLYRSLDMRLLPARSVAVVIAIAVMAYSRLRRGSAGGLTVAPPLVLRSVVLMAVGAYLIVLGVLGEGLRYVSAPVQRPIFWVCVLIVSAVFLSVLFSEKIRRRVKIYLHQNFYQNKYDYRRQWQNFSHCLGAATSAAQLHLAVLEFYSETFALPGGMLYLREAQSGHYLLHAELGIHGLPTRISASSLLISALAHSDEVVDVQSGSARHRQCGDFLQPCAGRFVVPLRFDQRLEGFLVLAPPQRSRERIDYEDYDLMQLLARQTTFAVLNLKSLEQLAVGRELAAMGRLSTFVLHDLKNQLSSLALLVDNAHQFLAEPEFQHDLLETLDDSLLKMKDLICRLTTIKTPATLAVTRCNLLTLARQIAAQFAPRVVVSGAAVFAMVDQDELKKVIMNLVLNALDASSSGQQVTIDVGEDPDPVLRVCDQGCGMSEEFLRSRLFKPFVSTKENGFGVGLYQCRQVIEAHAGQITVDSRLGHGSVFTVRLPVTAAPLRVNSVGAHG